MKRCKKCGSEDVKIEFDDFYFCSEECLKEFIVWNYIDDSFEESVYKNIRYYCRLCGKEIRNCDFCNISFEKNDEVICSNYGHFCSEKCLKRFIERLNKDNPIKIKIDKHIHYYCSGCLEVIDTCDYCDKKLKKYDRVICSNYGHFCSIDCLKNYIIEKHSKKQIVNER